MEISKKCFPAGLCGESVFQALTHQPHASGFDGFPSHCVNFLTDLPLVVIKGE